MSQASPQVGIISIYDGEPFILRVYFDRDLNEFTINIRDQEFYKATNDAVFPIAYESATVGGGVTTNFWGFITEGKK